NATGVVVLDGGQLLLTNLQPSAIGVNGSGKLIVSNGVFQSPPGFLLLGSTAGSQGTLTVAGGNYVAAPYGRLALSMETGATAVVTIESGNLVMTNTFLTLVAGFGSGQLTLLSGTNTIG